MQCERHLDLLEASAAARKQQKGRRGVQRLEICHSFSVNYPPTHLAIGQLDVLFQASWGVHPTMTGRPDTWMREGSPERGLESVL